VTTPFRDSRKHRQSEPLIQQKAEMDFITGSAGMPYVRALNGFETLKTIPLYVRIFPGANPIFPHCSNRTNECIVHSRFFGE
jgi:hypothetical protein